MTEEPSGILVDTSVLIDLLQGADTTEAMFLEWLIRENRNLLRITDLSFIEILAGLKSDAAALETTRALKEFVIVSPSGVELMVKAAGNYRSLRKKGITILSMIDCLIAT